MAIKMKIKYLGTAAAEGVPAMFCGCEYCKNIIKLGESEFRTRAQVLIDDDLSVDFPPEAYSHALKCGKTYENLKYLLVTHSHMDHFYAHDFILKGYKYAKLGEDVLKIYGNSEVESIFYECTRREMKKEVAPHLSFTSIKPYEKLKIGDYTVLTLPAQHTVPEQSLLYYIERKNKGYLHFYDTSIVEDGVFEFLRNNGAKAGLVSFDCTFTDNVASVSKRHMGIEENMLMKDKLKSFGVIDDNTKIVITHFSHNSNPIKKRLAEIEKKYGVIAAYDGLEIEI